MKQVRIAGLTTVSEAGALGGNTTYQKYGSEFYRKIGSKGGKKSTKRKK